MKEMIRVLMTSPTGANRHVSHRQPSTGGGSLVHRLLALVIAVVLGSIPVIAVAQEKQITDVKELAGSWQGWVTSQLGGQQRVMMTIKEDGSYEGSTIGAGS